MARILALDDAPSNVRAALSASLRVFDESVVLPCSSRSTESNSFKNVAFRLSSSEKDLSPTVFSENWFTGVSVVPIPASVARPILDDPRRRNEVLQKFATLVPSETSGPDVQVGPALDGDDCDRDTAAWVCGFDTPSGCIGLYSTARSLPPEIGIEGFDRVHNEYFLVCRAGGGLAAQTFHSRLTKALANGTSLDDCFTEGASPGAQALRRVTLAAQRNRGRILIAAAKVLGHDIDTISDQASPLGTPYRVAIPAINVTTNSLREVSDAMGATSYQYCAGCVDSGISQGLLSSSNVSEGFVVFSDAKGDFRVPLVNPAYSCLPFATHRLKCNRDAVMLAADKYKRALSTNTEAHPDAEWIRSRFAWPSKSGTVDIEPSALWGSHSSECWVSHWARELGVAHLRVVRLSPEVVGLPPVDAAKLRAATKHVQQ
jgi:hypothetical protein